MMGKPEQQVTCAGNEGEDYRHHQHHRGVAPEDGRKHQKEWATGCTNPRQDDGRIGGAQTGEFLRNKSFVIVFVELIISRTKGCATVTSCTGGLTKPVARSRLPGCGGFLSVPNTEGIKINDRLW